MKIISKSEEQALRYYIGDVSGIDSFYGDSKAYVTLNSLFFPDLLSESARTAEGKFLNPAIIADIPRLFDFFEALFSAFGKAELEKPKKSFRVERMSDYEICRRLGRTVSLTSTSFSGFLDYYRDRRRIALMKFTLPEGTHCIDAAEMLKFYAKPEESELLIPPFLKLEFAETAISETEIKITDCNGNSPEISVNASVSGLADSFGTASELSKDGNVAGMRVYTALNNGIQPDISDIELYSLWKKALQLKLYELLDEFI